MTKKVATRKGIFIWAEEHKVTLCVGTGLVRTKSVLTSAITKPRPSHCSVTTIWEYWTQCYEKKNSFLYQKHLKTMLMISDIVLEPGWCQINSVLISQNPSLMSKNLETWDKLNAFIQKTKKKIKRSIDTNVKSCQSV